MSRTSLRNRKDSDKSANTDPPVENLLTVRVFSSLQSKKVQGYACPTLHNKAQYQLVHDALVGLRF